MDQGELRVHVWVDAACLFLQGGQPVGEGVRCMAIRCAQAMVA